MKKHKKPPALTTAFINAPESILVSRAELAEILGMSVAAIGQAIYKSKIPPPDKSVWTRGNNYGYWSKRLAVSIHKKITDLSETKTIQP